MPCVRAKSSAGLSQKAARKNIAARVRSSFSLELEFAARIVRRFYRGSFLGTAVTTRMVQFLQRNAVFRQLLSDLFCGTQDYTDAEAARTQPPRRHAQPVREQRTSFRSACHQSAYV